MEQQVQPQTREKIRGWKAIAVYLNRSVRTAMEYRRTRGLKVREDLEGIYQFRDVLDAFIAANDREAA